MYNNDPKDNGKPKFPTRFGQAQGSAIERKMLDTVGGMDTIRTRVMMAPDGSETLLKTGGGLARFTNEPVKPDEPKPAVPKRTFVFSRVAGMASASIANRNNSSLKVVRRGMQVNQDVSYFVHSYKTDTKVRWGDVYRLDSHAVKINGKQSTPTTVAYVGTNDARPGQERLVAKTPALPYKFKIPPATTLLNGRTGIFLGTTEGLEQINYFDEYRPKVAQVKADGTVGDIVVLTDGPAWGADYATGVRCDKSGKYSFAWMVGGFQDPNIVSAYAEITTAINAAPALSKMEVNTVANPGFSLSTNTSISDWTTNERIVGWFYARWHQRLIYPPPWGFNEYDNRPWAVEYYYPNKTYNVFGMSRKRTINRSLSGSIPEQHHYQGSPYLMTVSGLCVGSETVTDEIGWVDPNQLYEKKIYSDAGEEWKTTRNSTSTLIAKFNSPIIDITEIYKAELVNDTMLTTNGLNRVESVWWNWDASPVPFIISAGDYWVECKQNDEDDYNGISRNNIETSIAQFNTVMDEQSETYKWYGPPDISNVFPHVEYESDREPIRTDTYSLTVKAIDFIYADPDNGVAVYMESLLTSVFRYSKSGAFPNVFLLPDIWSSVTSTLKIDFVVKHRNREFIHKHYNKPTHLPEFAWGSCSEPGNEDIEKYFTGIHVPPLTTPTFNPIYMSQGKCPWIAYTTSDEEAGIDGNDPATPEFYLDMKLSPKPTGTVTEGNKYGPTLYADTTTFTAHQLCSLVRNYLSRNAPHDYWESVLFPEPVKLRFSYGIPNPWVDAIGEPFTVDDHVTISRI